MNHPPANVPYASAPALMLMLVLDVLVTFLVTKTGEQLLFMEGAFAVAFVAAVTMHTTSMKEACGSILLGTAFITSTVYWWSVTEGRV